jgi:hypothetical protein
VTWLEHGHRQTHTQTPGVKLTAQVYLIILEFHNNTVTQVVEESHCLAKQPNTNQFVYFSSMFTDMTMVANRRFANNRRRYLLRTPVRNHEPQNRMNSIAFVSVVIGFATKKPMKAHRFLLGQAQFNRLLPSCNCKE